MSTPYPAFQCPSAAASFPRMLAWALEQELPTITFDEDAQHRLRLRFLNPMCGAGGLLPCVSFESFRTYNRSHSRPLTCRLRAVFAPPRCCPGAAYTPPTCSPRRAHAPPTCRPRAAHLGVVWVSCGRRVGGEWVASASHMGGTWAVRERRVRGAHGAHAPPGWAAHERGA